MSGYPDTSTRVEVPLEMLIKRADPDFYRSRRDETEYVFSNGRRFGADPSTRGAYDGYFDDTVYLTTEDGTFLSDEAGNLFTPGTGVTPPTPEMGGTGTFDFSTADNSALYLLLFPLWGGAGGASGATYLATETGAILTDESGNSLVTGGVTDPTYIATETGAILADESGNLITP